MYKKNKVSIFFVLTLLIGSSFFAIVNVNARKYELVESTRHVSIPRLYLDSNPDELMVNSHYTDYNTDDFYNYDDILEKTLIGLNPNDGTTEPPWDDYEADVEYIGLPPTATYHEEDATGNPNTGDCHLHLMAINILAEFCHTHAYCWFKGSYICTNTGDYYVNFDIDFEGIVTTYDVILPVFGWELDKKFEVFAAAGFQIAGSDPDYDMMYYKESFPYIGQYDIPSFNDEQPPLTIGYNEPITLEAGYEYEFVVQFNLYLDSYVFAIGSAGGNIDLDCSFLEANIIPRQEPNFVDLVSSETIKIGDEIGYTIWSDPWYFEPGDDVVLRATIWNDGFHDAHNFRVAMGLMDGNGNNIWWAVSDYVDCPAGDWPDNALTFYSSAVEWPDNTDIYYIWCEVDYYDDVDELCESNNVGIHPHRAQGDHDLEIEESTLIQCDPWPPDIDNLNWQQPDSFTEGDRVTPMALISNVGDGVAINCDIDLYMDDDLFASGAFSLERGDVIYAYIVNQDDDPGFYWPDNNCHTFRWELDCDGEHEEEEDTYCPEVEDTTPPDTEITDGPSGVIDYGDVSFSWTGSDDSTPTQDLEYKYMLEGYSGWSSWTSSTSKNYYDLSNGEYTFKVKARDEAHNEDPSPATRSFTVEIPDTIPPDTEITDGPSGTIEYNDILFIWTGSDDKTPTQDLEYSYKLEGYSGWSSWTSSTSKNYYDLSNGEYTFKVKARDEAHNEDPSPATRSFTVEIWITPDSDDNPDAWEDESDAYDQNTNTFAKCPTSGAPFYEWEWTSWLTLFFDNPKICSKIRWWAWEDDTFCDRIEIKVYDGGNQRYSYEGEYDKYDWEIKTMGSTPKQVTHVKVRFRVKRTLLVPTVRPDLHELQFYEGEE